MVKTYTLEELKIKYEGVNSPEQIAPFVKWGCFPIEPVTGFKGRVRVVFFNGRHKGYLGEVSPSTLNQKKRQAELSSKRGRRELRLDNLLPKERVRFVRDTLEGYGYEILSMPENDIKALTPIVVVGINGVIRETNWNSLQKTISRRKTVKEGRDLFTSRKNKNKLLAEWANKYNVKLNSKYLGYSHIYTGTVLEGQYKGLSIEFGWSKVQNDSSVQFGNLTKESKVYYIERLLKLNKAKILELDEDNEIATFLTKHNKKLVLCFGAVASRYKRSQHNH